METLLIPLEYRADESNASPGLLTGVVMSYGKRAKNLPEMFADDSLHWRDDGIVIWELHPPKDRNGEPIPSMPPLTRTMPYLEGRNVMINAPLPRNQRGQHVAESMRGPLPMYGGLSLEFRAERVTREGGIRVIKSALLEAAALVFRGEYAESTVEVRGEIQTTGRRMHLWL